MAKQIVIIGNRVVAHGEDCFLCMGGTVVCEETGRSYSNATIAEVDAIPADIDSVGYEYHAGVFTPCAPYGKGYGNLAVVCNDDCKAIKDSGMPFSGLLADDTKTLFGLGTDAVPDDVFGLFVKHCWARRYLPRNVSVEETPVTDFEIAYFSSVSSSVKVDFTYGDSYAVINADIRDFGNPELALAGTVDTVSPSGVATISTAQNALVGKYTVLTTGANAGAFCYIPEGATLTRDSKAQNYTVDSAVVLTVSYTHDERNEWDYVFSDDSAAYPTGETEDGWEYIYCGIPFYNAARASRVSYGSYVGTNTYDEDGKCSLTFDFEPKLVFIYNSFYTAFNRSGSTGNAHFDNDNRVFYKGGTRYPVYSYYGSNTSGTASASSVYYTMSGNTLEWYCPQGAEGQMNLSINTYHYVAIG